MNIIFQNTPNKKITHEDQDIYLSRSVAVVVICGDIINNDVVVVRRGTGMDYSGHYCLPCGYLDYDESVEQAAARELYEETGLIISPEKLKLIEVRSNPQLSERQNVSMVFACDYADTVKSDYTPDVNEVDEVTWFRQLDEKALLAFNHDKIIGKLIIANQNSLEDFKEHIIESQKELHNHFDVLAQKSNLSEEGQNFLFDFLFNDQETNSWYNYISQFGKTIEDLREGDKFNQPL